MVRKPDADHSRWDEVEKQTLRLHARIFPVVTRRPTGTGFVSDKFASGRVGKPSHRQGPDQVEELAMRVFTGIEELSRMFLETLADRADHRHSSLRALESDPETFGKPDDIVRFETCIGSRWVDEPAGFGQLRVSDGGKPRVLGVSSTRSAVERRRVRQYFAGYWSKNGKIGLIDRLQPPQCSAASGAHQRPDPNQSSAPFFVLVNRGAR